MNPWWLQPPAEEPGKDDKPDARGDGGRQSGRRRESGDDSGVVGPESLLEPPPREAAARPDGKAASGRTPSGAEKEAGEPSPPGERPRQGAPAASPAGEPGRPRRRRGGRRRRAAAGAVVEEISDLAAPSREEAAESRMALFCDLEQLTGPAPFDIRVVLERLLEKGKIVVKKAYADWSLHADLKQVFHDAGIELIDIPGGGEPGRGSAEVKLAVDAMELCFAKDHLDTFVLLSGDGDLSPLASKLKENNKQVLGIGFEASSDAALVDNCDEFIFYEDVERDERKPPRREDPADPAADAMELMADAIVALQRENKEVLWGSMIKQTMRRKHPSFNEGFYGYASFSELLEDAESRNLVQLKKDPRSGSYVVTQFSPR